MKQTWPAPERNKGPILDVLRRILPSEGRVLEIASGSGQHVAHFASNLPGLHFVPSDPDEDNRASIRAHVSELALPNLAEPLAIDVLDADWASTDLDAILCSNMIHIAPWACALALLDGARRSLRDGGILVLYGPFRIAGERTAESNEAFDADLRRRNAEWGVRDLDVVVDEAARRGFVFVERTPMPANNQTVVLRLRG